MINKAIKDSLSYAEQFSQFMEFLRQCEADYSMAQGIQTDAEAETQDILHELELEEITYHEYARLSKALKEVRIKRREAKDIAEQLEPLVVWETQNNKTIKELEKVLGEMRKAEKSKQNRHYNPKTDIVSATLNKD